MHFFGGHAGKWEHLAEDLSKLRAAPHGALEINKERRALALARRHFAQHLHACEGTRRPRLTLCGYMAGGASGGGGGDGGDSGATSALTRIVPMLLPR